MELISGSYELMSTIVFHVQKPKRDPKNIIIYVRYIKLHASLTFT